MKRVLLWGSLTVSFVVGAVAWIVRGERAPESTHLPVPPVTPPPPGLRAAAFPWDGTQVLANAQGETLSCTVERLPGELRLTGVHPRWQVVHHARPDGTPLRTEKRKDGNVIRVSWEADGTHVERTDAAGQSSKRVIQLDDLWDVDTIAARLAGVPWTSGLKVRMHLLDMDLADGTVYPMVAEALGEERCGETRCLRVHLEVDDLRRLVAPAFNFRYAAGPGARYLGYEGAGETFTAP